MSHFPATAAGKALLDDASSSAQLDTLGAGAEGKLIFADTTAAAILTELDVTAAGQAILDDANAAAQLTTLGVTAAAQTLLDDASTAAMLATLNAEGFTLQTKTASFTAADRYYYEVDSSGAAVTATLPSAAVNLRIGFKLVTAGNNLVLDGAAAELIDGAATYTMSVAGEMTFLRTNTAGTAWMIE